MVDLRRSIEQPFAIELRRNLHSQAGEANWEAELIRLGPLSLSAHAKAGHDKVCDAWVTPLCVEEPNFDPNFFTSEERPVQ